MQCLMSCGCKRQSIYNEAISWVALILVLDIYESIATVGEIRVWWRADFQSGSRVLKMAIILPTGQWYAPSAVINDA